MAGYLCCEPAPRSETFANVDRGRAAVSSVSGVSSRGFRLCIVQSYLATGRDVTSENRDRMLVTSRGYVTGTD